MDEKRKTLISQEMFEFITITIYWQWNKYLAQKKFLWKIYQTFYINMALQCKSSDFCSCLFLLIDLFLWCLFFSVIAGFLFQLLRGGTQKLWFTYLHTNETDPSCKDKIFFKLHYSIKSFNMLHSWSCEPETE